MKPTHTQRRVWIFIEFRNGLLLLCVFFCCCYCFSDKIIMIVFNGVSYVWNRILCFFLPFVFSIHPVSPFACKTNSQLYSSMLLISILFFFLPSSVYSLSSFHMSTQERNTCVLFFVTYKSMNGRVSFTNLHCCCCCCIFSLTLTTLSDTLWPYTCSIPFDHFVQLYFVTYNDCSTVVRLFA